MNLFFETRGQALVFLAMTPLGFLTGALLSLGFCAGRFRALWDVLALLCCGAGLLALLVLSRDDGLRLYHLLALCTGACLYLLGARRLALSVARAVKNVRKRGSQNKEK